MSMPIRSRRDRQLSQALERHVADMMAAMPSEAELAARYTFSPEFEARMQQLIQRSRQEAGLPPIQSGLLENQPPARQAHAGAPGHPAGHSADRLEYPFPSLHAGPAARGAAEPDSRGIARLPRRGKRLLLVAIILAILVSTFGLVAAREPIARFFVRVYEKFSWIVFNTPDGSAEPTMPGAGPASRPSAPGASGQPGQSAGGTTGPAADPASGGQAGLPLGRGKVPTRVPDGYLMASRTEFADSLQIVYVNSSNDELTFERSLAGTIGMIVDSEGADAEKAMIGLNEGIYYSKQGIGNLIWQDGQFAYHVSGNLSKEEATNIATFTK